MKLFDRFQLSDLELSSRVIMAPLTRRRCTRDHVPTDIMQTYYAQRAGAGLIIAEGCSPSPNGAGYSHMPGLYNQEQKNAWSKITQAIHDQGGKVFLQVMHTGRCSNENNLDPGAQVVAPSAIALEGVTSTYDHGKQAYTLPKAMSTEEVVQTIEEYVQCAKLAIEAGFDGIEIHGAHGYLPNQFFNASSNTRTDQYGGGEANRVRFVLEVIEACAKAIGSEKVGLRVSPFSYADTQEKPEDLIALHKHLAEALNSMNLSYLHLSHMGEPDPQKFLLWKEIRNIYQGKLMLCGDFTKEKAEESIRNNEADLVAFGRDFIANPDLVERFKHDWSLTERDRTNWYTLGEKGLTDYPTYSS